MDWLRDPFGIRRSPAYYAVDPQDERELICSEDRQRTRDAVERNNFRVFAVALGLALLIGCWAFLAVSNERLPRPIPATELRALTGGR